MKEQGQNLFQIGKSKAKKFKRDRTNTTFNDVAGLEGVIEELKEVVDFLKNPEKYIRLGAKTPKGILLFPGIFPWVLHSNYRMVINIFTVNHI